MLSKSSNAQHQPITNLSYLKRSKSIAILGASACLALTLGACSQENSPNETATVAENAPQTTQPSEAIRIAAAANLSDVLSEIIEGYKKDKNLPNQEIEVTFASSGKLYSQITAGAPYDI
ncbi:MAG TPA: hypothetical protein DCX43_09100, partial [Psychrobacter sp.]|nr:hypothetical protein [Psychrobacter sp.]